MGIFKTLAAILVMASVTIAVEAVAQTQAPPAGQRPPPGIQLPPGEDKIIEGEVRSIDPSGTEITLTNGSLRARGHAQARSPHRGHESDRDYEPEHGHA